MYTSKRNAMVGTGNRRTFTDKKSISDIIAEEYPSLVRDTPIFEKYVRRLKATLYLGRNWYMVAQVFGGHILSFVPLGGEFGIYDGMYTTESVNIVVSGIC
jgi:hypothetical protein